MNLYNADCIEKMKELPENSVDSIVCDPPYELGFMGKSWDSTGIANNIDMWAECLRVLKPGGHLLAFSGTRTYHRMASAIEDAGFEVRDMIEWVYGCLSEDTEILTKDGWKMLYSIFEGDYIFACDYTNDMKIQLEPVKQKFIYDYDEEAYHIKDTGYYNSELMKTDHIVSKNHNVLVSESWATNNSSYPDKVFAEKLYQIVKYRKTKQINSDFHIPGLNGFIPCTIEKIHYKGKVWCVEVESGAFVARRNGKIFITGNSGFPKSLNIGKAVDKLQGNKREVVGEQKLMGTARRMKGGNFNDFGGEDTADVVSLTKGTSEWEGWGTALKPAHEPICMARKPLGQQELDIAKNICYNITEKGLITNSKIIWRIKNVKGAEKQKKSNYSTPTQLQKTVEVSAEFVEMKGNESVGKKIQKLIDSICESGIQETGNKPEKQVLKAISKTKIEYQDTGENINTNEKQKLLKPTEESASVVENQDLSSLPLTTLEVVEDSTEKKSKMETSMSFLKSTDTQKTDTDCYAQTATSQWVCMDIVRTLKVSFEGKEYDFIELSDGSLVWNENLEPYRKQQKLNVAENVLKYGTGGINIDESRVEGEPTPINKLENWSGFGQEKRPEYVQEINNQGRFPANLIHDNSEEVRECFPDSKSGSYKGEGSKSGGIWSKSTGEPAGIEYGDSGNASRFFKSIIYQVKSSRRDRTSNGTVVNFHPTVKSVALMEYLIKMVTPKGGTVLDPFMGSGSTGVACSNLDNNFIGIELDNGYIEIAKSRIENTQSPSLSNDERSNGIDIEDLLEIS